MVIQEFMKYFAYEHLPEHLQRISKPFADLATEVAGGPDNSETRMALRKILEAKDCAVRAYLN